MILLPTQWRQQSVNNSCSQACLAMLLSSFGIDKEDFQIIEDGLFHYMIDYSHNSDSFLAGTLCQDDENFDIAIAKYNLKFKTLKFDDYDSFLQKARKILAIGQPFITSVPPKYISSPGYDKIRYVENAGSHAIVIYKFDNDEFYMYDPIGGLDRSEKYEFENIKDFVSLSISSSDLKSAMHSNKKYLLGFLEGLVQNDSAEKLILRSINSITSYSNIIRLNLENMFNDFNYNSFYNFLRRLIIPIVFDLANTISAVSQKTHEQIELENNLKNYAAFIRKEQIKVKNKEYFNIDIFKENILTMSNDLTNQILNHLEYGLESIRK